MTEPTRCRTCGKSVRLRDDETARWVYERIGLMIVFLFVNRRR